MQSLAQAASNDLKASLQGDLLRAEDLGYNAAHHLAILTFGVLQEGRDHPQNQDFLAYGPPVHGAAANTLGFVRTIDGKERNKEPFSSLVTAEQREYIAQVLSLWANLEALFAFSYSHLHGEVLSKRKSWFLKPAWPTYVLWWVADTHTPDWLEAYQRHNHLHRYGPTPQAFDFKHPFDAMGNPTQLDRVAVNNLTQLNKS